MRAVTRLGGTERQLIFLLPAVVAGVIFWVAYDDGSYGLPSRGTLAVALWWAIVVGVAFGLTRVAALPRAALVMGGLIAALAVWTLASVFWASSAEDAFEEFNRVTLYLGVFILVTLTSTRRDSGRWCNGLALGIVGIAVVALVSRLFPGVFPDRALPTFLPSSVTRLSFPLGYWNGLGIFVALGLPLLLRLAVVGRSATVRGLALAPVPAMAAAVYLTSSRGGVATAVAGAVAFLALTERRWSTATALALTAFGSAAAIAVLLGRNELVNGPLGTDVVRSQGRSAALLIALTCAATAAAYGLVCRLLGGRIRPGRWAGRILVALVVIAVVGGIAASDPAERFEVFKRSPTELQALEPGDFVRAHLLSGSGSGRWQFWTAAADEWRENPLRGAGAGSYEQWWAEHASFSYFVRDAHSLYLELLGELGIVGLAFAAALVLAGVGVGARRSLRVSGDERVTAAALTATFAAYGFAAGFDWVWELAAVSVAGFVALALITGPATATVQPRLARPDEVRTRVVRRSFGLGIAALVVAWVVISAQTIPLLVQRALGRSEEAVRRGDLVEAEREALSALEIQPWAARPYLQLSLVDEREGQLRQARTRIEEAIDRDPRDWRLWLVAARVETKLGNVERAEQRLRRAVELNPRSPLFEGLLENQGTG